MARHCLLPFVVLPFLVLASGCDESGVASAQPPVADDDDATAAQDAGASEAMLPLGVDPANVTELPASPPREQSTSALVTVRARDAAGRHAQSMAERDARAVARARRVAATIAALERRGLEDQDARSDSRAPARSRARR